MFHALPPLYTGWLSEREFKDNCPDFFALKEKEEAKKSELVGKMTEASCDRVMEEIRRKRIAEPEPELPEGDYSQAEEEPVEKK